MGVQVPTFRPAARAIGIGSFFASSGPTIAADDPRFPFFDAARTPAWFVDERDDVAAAQALAIAHGVPLGYYHDGHGLNPAMVPKGERAWIYGYPAEGVSLGETFARVRADINRCVLAGVPFDLVVATYCQYRGPGDYALTEPQVLDALVAMWDLAVTHDAGAVWCFAERRGTPLVDGYAYWPNLAEAVRRMRAASLNPNVFPVRAGAPVRPTDPIQEFIMQNAFSGCLTLQKSRFEKSIKLPDRSRYKLDDGTYLSIDKATGAPRVDANGNIKGTTNDGSSEGFYLTTPGCARVICDALSLGEFTFLVDETR